MGTRLILLQVTYLTCYYSYKAGIASTHTKLVGSLIPMLIPGPYTRSSLVHSQVGSGIRVIRKINNHVFGPPFTPFPLFQWYPQSKDILINLTMKC
jgi:hypothetical protein